MWIREYKPADCEQMAELFYNTVRWKTRLKMVDKSIGCVLYCATV